MLHEKLVTWFLPQQLRYDKAHPDYYEMYNVVNANLVGCLAMSIIPLVLLYFHVGTHLWTYYLNVFTFIVTLFSMRIFAHWRIPTLFCAAVAYYIVYTWLEDSGMIYSTNIAMIHMYLLAALIVDRRLGWIVIISNMIFLGIIYHLTVTTHPISQLSGGILGSAIYALLMHTVITVFMGGFLAYSLRSQDEARKRIKALQDQKISLLDEAVRKRTEQLNGIRQTIASDFHDQTGNMLAAINRQAAMLELKLFNSPDVLPLIKSIITNSNELFTSSKDFLWNLNHDSDDPHTLFKYLTGFGQNFYNQFDISFSAELSGTLPVMEQLNPFAALNMIYIFKEAMGNVVKHSGADEVIMRMACEGQMVTYTLLDNGQWKNPTPETAHYGLGNIERRCRQSGFEYHLHYGETGTCIAVASPLHAYFVKNQAQ